MAERQWDITRGDGPIVAVAVHDGHDVRGEVADLLALDDGGRRREEDPYTGGWTTIVPLRCVVHRSRFEVDLNRPRHRAVYRVPADAWGLDVWRHEPSEDFVARSLALYDAFYGEMQDLLQEVADRHGRFVVFDLHSYNHRRDGRDAAPAPPAENPQVNLGTGTLDRARWAPIIERFMSDLGQYDFAEGRLDVRENVKFKGGQFSRWVHQTFPTSGCALAIEFKKFFMDEHTGESYPDIVAAIKAALESTLPGVLETLGRG
jgi:N-formylglutamate deformylase